MFITNLKVEKVMGSDDYRLLSDLVYKHSHVDEVHYTKILKAPTDSLTDWASFDSVHWLLRGLIAMIFKKHGPWDRAAALHDAGYRHTLMVAFSEEGPFMPFHETVTDDYSARQLIDKLFYSSLRSDGVSRFAASIFYLGVRLGGKSSFVDGKYKHKLEST